jgi:group I intron endonuclease
MMAIAFLGKDNSLKRNISNNNNSNLTFNKKIPDPRLKSQDDKPSIDNYKKKYENLHLISTQLKINKDNKHKSGIYLIFNNINDKYYIGSAITNRINSRFRSHCLNKTGGSLLLNRAINKYGLENFTFYILEYYPGFVHKEDLKKAHLALLKIETNYINLLNPEYNILTIAGSSLGFKHSKETIEKLRLINTGKKASLETKLKLSLALKGKKHTKETKDIISIKNIKNYTLERKTLISKIHTNKIVSKETKELLSKKMKIRYLEKDLRNLISLQNSNPLILYNIDNSIYKEYKSKKEFMKEFNCCHKTINKYLKNLKNFRNWGNIKLKDKTN